MQNVTAMISCACFATVYLRQRPRKPVARQLAETLIASSTAPDTRSTTGAPNAEFDVRDHAAGTVRATRASTHDQQACTPPDPAEHAAEQSGLAGPSHGVCLPAKAPHGDARHGRHGKGAVAQLHAFVASHSALRDTASPKVKACDVDDDETIAVLQRYAARVAELNGRDKKDCSVM